MTELLRLVKDASSRYSVLKPNIEKLVEKCDKKIGNGACEQYEIECCYESIKNLVNEFELSMKKFVKHENVA